MPGVIELLFALGMDDLRVVRYGCWSVRQDYPLFEHPAFSCDFLASPITGRLRFIRKHAPVNDNEP